MKYLAWIPSLLQKSMFLLSGLSSNQLQFDVTQSIWLGYEITSPEFIQKKLPPNLELSPCSVFEEKSRPALFFNFLEFESSLFRGHRLEFLTVAKERTSGRKHFVILDYLSDTMSIDPPFSFRNPTRSAMHIHFDPKKGMHFCEIPSEFFLLSIHPNNQTKTLNSEFSVDCNQAIYYGKPEIHPPNRLSFSSNQTSFVELSTPIIVRNSYYDTVRSSSPYISFFYPHPVQFHIALGNKNNIDR